MRDISAHFKAHLRRGFQLASFVEVWGPSSSGPIATSDTFTVTQGEVVVDGSASIQRRLDNLMVVDNTGDLVPNKAADLFSVVSANELRVYTGMVIPETGVQELLLQGIFGLEGAVVEDTEGGVTITLSAYDRARQIERARTIVDQKLAASNPPATTAITSAQELVIAARAGQVGWSPQFKVQGVDPQLGHPELILPEGTDPWAAARKIMEGIGWEMFFDWDGQVVMRPVLDPNSTQLTSSWTYAEGTDSTLLGLVRGFSNEEAFNGQIVTGENTANGFPARGQAWDEDPTSPTWYQGPYGRVPEFVTLETVRTDAQATTAAVARLNQRKGANEQMQFSIVPNHAHEYGDVATITRAKSKVDRQYLIDGFSMALGAAGGAMTITTRQRKA
jgi:hypothetical protein